jgi:hypothetical protein
VCTELLLLRRPRLYPSCSAIEEEEEEEEEEEDCHQVSTQLQLTNMYISYQLMHLVQPKVRLP